jgi:hypothetical protein
MTTMTTRKHCSFPGCTHPLDAAGLCRGHRAQRDRGVELTPLREVGAGYVSISLRLRPETIEALRVVSAPGQTVTVTAREILQAATKTGPR